MRRSTAYEALDDLDNALADARKVRCRKEVVRGHENGEKMKINLLL